MRCHLSRITWKQRLFFMLLLSNSCDPSPAISSSSLQTLPAESDSAQCRDRSGLLDPTTFNQRSCALCYYYLFPRGKALAPQPPFNQVLFFVSGNLSQSVVPDPNNETSLSAVCSTLSTDECRQWIGCCEAADECCRSQLKAPPRAPASRKEDASYCDRIWDGFSCWEDTTAGSMASRPCPTHLDHSITTKSAIKTCLANGTWLEKNGMQWTDYRPCVDKESNLIGVYMSFACNALSIVLLVPAIAIFCLFRELVKQHRIRVHINFFVSLVLCSSLTIPWYGLVHYDLLVNPLFSETVFYRNPVWCRLLSFAKIYSTSATYFWMFNEGFYLHRLITHTFEPPKSLRGLCLLGWLMPALGATVYAIIRGAVNNENCWAKSFGEYQWIIYAPNFLCMVLNFVFLCNILRILMFRLHSHPHEPSNFRRGVKAAFMLIPLFGLQLFLTIYRPPIGGQTEIIHECVFLFTTNSQGIFVSLIFCFFNGEVLSRMPCFLPGRGFRCCFYRDDPSCSPRSRGVSTQLTQFTLGEIRHSLSNMAFYPSVPSPSNGLLTASTGGLQRNPSPTSCHSLAPGVANVGAFTPERKRKSASLSTTTEIEHVVDQRPSFESPTLGERYHGGLFPTAAASTGQRSLSPGKVVSRYAALPTTDSG